MSDIKTLLRSDAFKQSIQERQAISPEDAAKFVSMFESAVRKNPDLLSCSPKSIELAAYKLADLGLSPVDTFNQVYLYYRWNNTVKSNECVIDVGWRGLCTLAYKLCGISIESEVIFGGETFQCEKGTIPVLRHVIDINAVRSEDNMVAVYAKATLPGGIQKYEIMTKLQTDGIKKISIEKNKKMTPAWANFYTEMARKSVVKRLCKQLNELEKINRIIDLESEEDYFDDAKPHSQDASKTAAQKLSDRIRSNVQKERIALAHEEKVVLDVQWQEEDEVLLDSGLPDEYAPRQEAAL